MGRVDLALSRPQGIFLNGLNTKFQAYVGGLGSGKTYVACLRLLIFALKNRSTSQGFFGISYQSIRNIFYPTIEEAAAALGLSVQIRLANKEVDIYLGVSWIGTIICRSMDQPQAIVGFKISNAVVDELDVLPSEKAEVAWNKIIARLRLVISGVENCIGVTTTPEGFRFVYKRFAEKPTSSYSMVQASTYENRQYLPPDYIDSLLETYPKQLAAAYIDGKFVNLTSGTVYSNYSRRRHRSKETVQDNEPLRIGQDFNINNMAAVVYVDRGGKWHAADEVVGGRDTPSTIDTIKGRYGLNRHITIYPDASGKNRSTTGASTSDIALLKQAGFSVRAKESNPLVKDRVLAVNMAFERGDLFVNPDTCPTFAKGLEQQAYDKSGAPDKTTGHDHINDAGGYPIAFEMPIRRPVSKPSSLPGIFY